MTITEIGRLTSLAKTTLTSMLDRMEASGLVERIPDKKNRRQIIVSITPEAKSLSDEYEKVSEQMNRVFYDGFSEEEIESFENTLRRIIVNLGKKE